ncbi:hypothetical protein [Streptomyces hesseae]|uniref:Uncharacterized protein n=1 Tax=Streptomyces hesseae TaxID=3075519 RepID=A0ABU2SSX3_9ACTN|nr:hypothetical protein [Streptomyces sp. DSM 40473]MDT0450930.1 hypothetical protein [Streptomyces sp. DSM 40473]
MRSEKTPFEGGPLDGRVLDVLLGLNGLPPKKYEVPVPAEEPGAAPTVYVYRREPAAVTRRLGLPKGWKYAYDPEGKPGVELKWPWSRPSQGPQGSDAPQKPHPPRTD